MHFHHTTLTKYYLKNKLVTNIGIRYQLFHSLSLIVFASTKKFNNILIKFILNALGTIFVQSFIKSLIAVEIPFLFWDPATIGGVLLIFSWIVLLLVLKIKRINLK